ncbi:MAG: dihydrodipicolinate synthase family protein [Oscillospiraceae bacterium]|nr:dihydrodipicolinate synthase family protein [Oscillospiraceae bacterium]
MKIDLSKFRGVFVALNAIYDENDCVNLEATKALVKIYREKGVKGVYVCGSTGEGFLLSTEERMQITEAVKEAAGNDFTVIVHVGCASSKESIILARHAEKIGVDAISAVPSVYYRLPAKSVEMHWNAIIDSTDLPFIIYNIPQLTSFTLPYDLFERMAKNPKVIGIKNSEEPVYNMERFRTIAGKDFIIFNGSDEQYLGGRLMGADAGIGGTYGTMPELFVQIDKFICEGKIKKAKELQYKINDIIFDLLSCDSLYGAAKQVISVRFNIDAGQPRSPFLPVKRDEKIFAIADKIEKAVAEINSNA